MSQPMAPEEVVKSQIASTGVPAAIAGMPTPARLFQTFNAYQQTAAMGGRH